MQKQLEKRKRARTREDEANAAEVTQGLSYVTRTKEQVEVNTLNARGQLHRDKTSLPKANS